MSGHRKSSRTRRNHRSKLVGFGEAVLIEGLAILLILIVFFGLRSGVRHQQRIELRWDAIRQQFEPPYAEQTEALVVPHRPDWHRLAVN